MEYRAAAGRGGEIHPALKPSDNLLDDVQVQSCAVLLTCVGGIDQNEFFRSCGLDPRRGCLGRGRGRCHTPNAQKRGTPQSISVF